MLHCILYVCEFECVLKHLSILGILKECVKNSISSSAVLHTAETCATELLKMVNSLNSKQREDNASIMVFIYRINLHIYIE